jgi:uncharacterized protein YcbK (DUF882 family)
MGWHVTTKVAHRKLLSSHSARAGYCCSIAALLIFFGCHKLQSANAEGDTRTISFHHVHTDEELTVTYKVNGRYDEEALRKINHLLRDWRESEPIKMDPHLIDLLWEVHREVGAKEAIWIICGYRSPQTNSMLRRRSSGVAEFSQHTLGKAIDFYIPGVPLERLREVGLRAQRGGVGFYPTSGAPFVHMDTGSVRHWPRMPEAQLASVLAKGQLKSTVAQADTQRGSPSLFARLFGGGRDEEEDAKTAAAPAKPAAPRKPATAPEARTDKPAVVAAASESRVEKVAAAPLPQAKPAKPESYQVASATAKPVAKQILASASSEIVAAPASYQVASATSKPVRLAQVANPVARIDASVNDIINERGYWRGLPSSEAADAPQAGTARATAPAARRGGATASADPAITASTTPWPLTDRAGNEPIPNALAYAAQPTPIATARTLPMGLGTSRAAPVAPPETTIAVKRFDDRPSSVVPPSTTKVSVVRVGDRFNDPWMRAMIVSPSAQNFMKTTLLGATDFRNLGPYLQKPATTVMTTFSNDPYRGMICEKFDGSAVVFVSTATFSTAALR